MYGVGWTPTDCGLVLNFEPGDQFLLSVEIDGVEYFVCDYPTYSGGKFSYTAGNTLKLIPQSAGATEPSPVSIWTIGEPLTRVINKVNYALGGISYTMWSSSNKTLITQDGTVFKYKGDLSANVSHSNLCDVIFVVPTNLSTNADPNNTMGRGPGAFDGGTGTGFLGMTYREVYMFDIPRSNTPNTYTNASIVTFNMSSTTQKWNGENVSSGRVYYAFADTKHNPTKRTLYRIYPLNKPFSSCNSYFFGWDVQDYKRYRQSQTMTDSTSARKVYTLDHFHCMERVDDTKIYKTDWMQIPSSDSTYYYVGKNNTYYADKAGVALGSTAGAYSLFTQISQLRIDALKGESTTYTPSAGACGRMVVDTTSGADNLGVTFEPAGYFLRTNSGRNIRLHSNADGTEWTCDEMWTISEEYAKLQIKTTLQTGPQFSETDEGADIAGWSELVTGTSVPVTTGRSIIGCSGWARIYPGNKAKNGGMVFVPADTRKCLIYDNNGLQGATVPNQYAELEGSAKVAVRDARLKEGFMFLGWATSPEGEAVYHAGDSITLEDDTITLYAKATFDDTYRVTFSFMHDGKRYYLTHPNASAPRFARARTFTDWTNVYQGMANADNSEPNYVSTFKMIGNPGACEKCETEEYVLNPYHEIVHGAEDSLIFYEHFAPANDEFLGLYYTDPNTVLANNTWAGIFKSTEGWPSYRELSVDSTKLYSSHYFTGMYEREDITREPRLLGLDYIEYKPATNQFDGTKTEADGTDFQIAAVLVADQHYVILPDTTDPNTPWTDEVVFDYHNGKQTTEHVWSKLIGKQLMAGMKVGKDTVYFHPNNSKTQTTASGLRLSLDYRLTQYFDYIHDSRAEIAESDRVIVEETDNDFCRRLISGENSPMNVRYMGEWIDICDTLRVRLRPMGTSKIADYYGRWKTDAEGVHVLRDGSRYRDILVKTKTYHYTDTITTLVLEPKQQSYSFSALANQSQEIQFKLTKLTYRELRDAAGAVFRRDTLATKDTTAVLSLSSDMCSFTGSYFAPVPAGASGDHVTIQTLSENSYGARTDTLIVTIPANTYSGVTYAIVARVPLIQSSLQGDELVWSAVHPDNGKRYYIMAGKDGDVGHFVFREYNLRGNTLYKLNTTTALIKGVKTVANNDAQYITPWKFTINPRDNNQLSLITKYGVDKFLTIDGDYADLHNDTTYFTYRLAAVNANANANYEEKVRIKYGSGKWLKFTGDRLTLQDDSASATIFYWSYLQQEYNLLNDGAYPSIDRAEFGTRASAASIKTAYKVYREYSMLVDNALTYLCREQKNDSTTMVSDPWKTTYAVSLIHDSRFKKEGIVADSAKLRVRTNKFTTTITPTGDSPMGTQFDGQYTDIVDTLQVTLGLQDGAPVYRFKDWKNVSSVSDACLKIPLVRKTYHESNYDSIVCLVDKEEYNFAFPSSLREGVSSDSLHTFNLETVRRRGTNTLDVDNNVISYVSSSIDTLTELMKLDQAAYAEIRLVDEFGKTPDWCEISNKGTNSVTMKCLSNGIRSPRSAYLYFAYIVEVDKQYKYVNFRLTVSQASLFKYANNQTLIHTPGASGDPLAPDGRQQVHENKRVLYYYNPEPYDEADQNVELPIRERSFYGWWRWYQENPDLEDTDIPDSAWITPPRNVGKFNYPFRIIGDSVDDPDHPGKKKLVTMGRYTVFHYPAVAYGSKNDPPAKSPHVFPPHRKDTMTYVVDLGNYYDNLPLSMAQINQVDTAVLDTMQDILEPTLSLREVFELHPWTEMAEKLEGYKTSTDGPFTNENYLEDHEVMAPIGNRLLLTTEQRYRYDNLAKKGHSESLLGYYMRDDNWSTWDGDQVRQDTMIWCGGWDATCMWFTYDPSSHEYHPCNHPVTESDDFLNVPAKTSITAGQEYDTVYYCLRSRSMHTTRPESMDLTVPGNYWFNLCRYKVIYHDPRKYGPKLEAKTNGVTKALITNDEIEQTYEVLERLNFDYNKPGSEYHVYPHPLPWSDASYGYSYPVSPEVPDNRYHNDFAPNFPGVGEYGIINRIPYSNYWHMMEQHGGAENGYMIYCDGMSSAGQVAALSLHTQLCEGQKMYFSGYVGNPSSQKGKSNPNFRFTVQGWNDKEKKWADITSYMTGDIQPSNKWYQIFFPINQEGSYDQFRVRIYNVSSDFDGNDFILDDMCIFATKPPLIAYQSDTKCVEEGKNDSITQVVLRVDYQGFVDESYNDTAVYYTVEQIKNEVRSFVPMDDGYINPERKFGADESKPDTLYGHISMPANTYTPLDKDSIFSSLQQLIDTFGITYRAWQSDKSKQIFRQGYLYENLDGVIRPVLYVVHEAKMAADNTYNVRMSLAANDLLDSKCAMTSKLNVTNRMMLELNGEEQEDNEATNMCANTTYDLSVRVKGSRYMPGTAPIDVNGSCVNDWLLYGDTAEATSIIRYGYKYSDIKKVIKDVLRCAPAVGTNSNQFAPDLASVNRNDLEYYAKNVTLTPGVNAYTLLSSLVNNGFLTLYQPKITTMVAKNDSVQYVVFPILGTGSDAMTEMNMEVCTTPMFIKLKSSKGGDIPLMVGGIRRDSTQANLPVVVLANARTANEQITLHIDSMMPSTAVHSITLLSTDDPDYYEGVHLLNMEPDKIYNLSGDNTGYYRKGDDILLRPATSNNYRMRPGYNYTFGITMQTSAGFLTTGDDCPVGVIPFTVSVVPDYLRWEPKSADNNKWNDPANWIGLDENYEPLHANAHFAPLAYTDVIIPAMTDGLPYPVLPDPESIPSADSVKQVGFTYNSCDDIRFLKGAAIGQQQRLSCDNVVVDLHIPEQTWALRSAPLTGMISGDIYIANADVTDETKPWTTGNFDANGRSYKTGNASFWLSLYSRETVHLVNGQETENRTAAAEWSKVTNGMTQSLAPAQGWAVYTHTNTETDAVLRLPKSDDIYYYYDSYGEKLYDRYVDNLRERRNTYAGGTAGRLAFQPDGNSQNYTLTHDGDVESASFVFGNPTMGYIDIWGFIADNSLEEEFSYLNASGVYTTVNKSTADATADIITTPERYLPPMHAIVITTSSAVSKAVTLNASRIVTSADQIVRPGPAPRRSTSARARGIMTVTAINPADRSCTSRLLLGQGYNDAIRPGEDAVLTTINVSKYNASTPSTPFNIYASEGDYGLSIDLRDEVLNVPVSFYMSELPFEPVTYLWFTGVNNIDGQLVLYDALSGSEQAIIDGICLTIETPEMSHETRYYIRRYGWSADDPTSPIATGNGVHETCGEQAYKIIRNGQVLIIRGEHVYTTLGQKLR